MKPIIVSLTNYQEISLDDLRKDITSENLKARNTAKKSLEHVRTCGEMLIALKGRAPHGTFGFELKGLSIEQRTANNYMRIASNWKHVSTLDHGVRDALKLLCRAENPIPSPAAPATPPPAPRATAAVVIVDAEIVEPDAPAEVTTPQPVDEEPETVVVDGTKPEALTDKETARLTELEAIIEKGQADAFAAIMEMIPLLSKDQLLELRRNITALCQL